MFEKIKYYYDKGIYKKFHLDVLFSSKAISQAEYEKIMKGEQNG